MKHDLYERRLAKDARLGHVNLIIESSFSEFDAHIVRRRNYWGVTDTYGIYLLPPVFDSIQEVVPQSGLIIATIDQDRMLYDLSSHVVLTELKSDVEAFCVPDMGSLELHAEGNSGLWSINEKKVLIPIAFDEVCHDSRSRFLWVRKGKEFDYIRVSDGKKMGLQNVINVYDSPSTMFIEQGESGMIKMLDSEGFEDELGLRRLVTSHQGRYKLLNKQHSLSVIIDVYGFILNR